MATCGTVRDMNLSRMREYMLEHRKVRIADAARETGMSIPTAAKLIGDLVENGEMITVGCCASTGGRCASLFEINHSYLSYLLLRVDGDKIRYQLKDYAGDCLESGCVDIGANAVCALDDLVLEAKARHENLKGIFLGAEAHVTKGCIGMECSTPGLAGLNVREHFETLTGLCVNAENETNLVAHGCWRRLEMAQGCIVCLHMTSQRQFSAGLVINGRSWEGRKGLSGEVHLMQALRIAQEKYQEMDVPSYFAFMAGMYAVTLDPDRIIVYQPPNIAAIDCDELRELCRKGLMDEYIPQIDVSDEWDRDYWTGLCMQMRKMLGIG